jgi:hypothetical protein
MKNNTRNKSRNKQQEKSQVLETKWLEPKWLWTYACAGTRWWVITFRIVRFGDALLNSEVDTRRRQKPVWKSNMQRDGKSLS